MPGIEEINSNDKRVTRLLKKKDKMNINQLTPKDTDNSTEEVVESSQESTVSIKPLEGETVCSEIETRINIEHKEKTLNDESEIEEQKKDTESCDPYEELEVPFVVNFDKSNEEPITNDVLAEKDTESLEIEDNLPGSPITVETPDRTTELLLNTSDISPIRTKILETALTPMLRQKTLEDYMQQSVGSCGNRSKKILDSLPTNKDINSEVHTSLCTPIQDPPETGTFLTFSRELPSHDAIPTGGSILKRKKPDYVDDISPCVKVFLIERKNHQTLITFYF